MNWRDLKPTRSSTLSLVVGLFFLLVVGVLLLLVFPATKQENEFAGQSFEQLLATLPEHPAADPDSPGIQTVKHHTEKLLPLLNLTLNGPGPLRYRLTKRLAPDLRTRIVKWLPTETATRLFITKNDLLLIREQSLRALSLIPKRERSEAIAILTEALARPEPALQRATIRELGKFGINANVAVPRLIPFLASLDPTLRYQAIKTLGTIGSPANPAIEIIQTRMSDSSEMVRAAAVVAYGRIVLPHNPVANSLLTAL
ncbi:MAG: HEAT repeat domain-containing protein, partial [Flavobacteriaceae bacterium]|nr:HEAT repeat domain-containing protein [Flavobacteriaceae bacterium]